MPSKPLRSALTFASALALALLAGPASAANFNATANANNTFSPSNLSIEVGDTVIWTNTGGIHNVRADNGAFTSGPPSGGAWMFSFTFTSEGSFRYYCEVHGGPAGAGMSGIVTVTAGGPGDEPGVLRFATGSASVGEGAGTVQLTVQRVSGDDGAVSVSWATGGGNATPGSDYEVSGGTLTWGDNDDDPRQISVAIFDDGNDESNETFNVTLSNPTGGATLGSPATATVTINDNDSGPPPPPPPPPGPCVEDAETLCLNDGRFRVTVDWTVPGSGGGAGQAIPYTPDSGFFWFFNEDNLEMMIKVLDACAPPLNGRYWVFFAATTNVGFTVTVSDTEANETNTYTSQAGPPAPATTDTVAFDTCP